MTKRDNAAPVGWPRDVKTRHDVAGSVAVTSASQLTLNFEPSLPERFASLREFIAHRVQIQAKPAKTIAADMDMSPSLLSRKLAPGEADTQRFNTDDLERFIQATGDTAAIEYLAAKYLQPDEARRAAALAHVERLASDLERALRSLKGNP